MTTQTPTTAELKIDSASRSSFHNFYFGSGS